MKTNLSNLGPILGVATGAVLLFTVACDTTASAPRETGAAILSQQLVGDALAALGPDGRFLKQPVESPAGVARTWSQSEAEAFVMLFWKTFGSSYREDVEARRGAPIDPAALRVCGNSLLAESTWESPPREELTLYRAHIGARWIVPLCQGSSPQVLISVAALLAELMPPRGVLSSPELLNAGLSITGIPAGSALAMSAEQAASVVASTTRLRVTKVPRLMRADAPLSGWWAMWAVEVEQPVEVRGARSGRARQTRTVFYGALPREGWRPAIADNLEPMPQDSLLQIQDISRSGNRAVMSVWLHRTSRAHFSVMEPVEASGGHTP